MTLNYKELYEDLLSDYYEVLSERNQAFADRRELAKMLRDERHLSSKLIEALVKADHKITELDYALWEATSPELAQL